MKKFPVYCSLLVVTIHLANAGIITWTWRVNEGNTPPVPSMTVYNEVAGRIDGPFDGTGEIVAYGPDDDESGTSDWIDYSCSFESSVVGSSGAAGGSLGFLGKYTALVQLDSFDDIPLNESALVNTQPPTGTYSERDITNQDLKIGLIGTTPITLVVPFGLDVHDGTFNFGTYPPTSEPQFVWTASTDVNQANHLTLQSSAMATTWTWEARNAAGDGFNQILKIETNGATHTVDVTGSLRVNGVEVVPGFGGGGGVLHIVDDKVGIGTDAPENALHVRTDSPTEMKSIFLEQAGDGAAGINFIRRVGVTEFNFGIDVDNVFKIADATFTGDFSKTWLKIDTQGNVGIGATGRPANFQVIGRSALGTGVTSSLEGQVVVGKYNNTNPSDNGTNHTQGVFVVGAGSGNSAGQQLNALRVLSDGTVLVKESGDIVMHPNFKNGPRP